MSGVALSGEALIKAALADEDGQALDKAIVELGPANSTSPLCALGLTLSRRRPKVVSDPKFQKNWQDATSSTKTFRAGLDNPDGGRTDGDGLVSTATVVRAPGRNRDLD